jgi:hypothetical protein
MGVAGLAEKRRRMGIGNRNMTGGVWTMTGDLAQWIQ